MNTTAFRPQLWRRRLWFWLGPLLLVTAAVGFLLLYRSVFAGRVDVLKQQFAREQQRLASLVFEREKVEAAFGVARASRTGMEHLYREVFSTERERLTSMIREVKQLAGRAGLNPPSISYPQTDYDDHGLVRKAVVFGVNGDYEALRRFINMLELSEHFLILESIRVGDADGGRLSIQLEISTLFVDETEQVGLETLSRAASGGGGS